MQIRYDLIQWPNVVLEKCEPFLSEVLDQGKDDEHFWRAFQVHWKSILVTLVGFSGAGGFCHPHFQVSEEFKHDADAGDHENEGRR